MKFCIFINRNACFYSALDANLLIIGSIDCRQKDTIVKQDQFYSRIHVEDIVMVIVAAMQNPKAGITIYNVADDEPAPSHVVEDHLCQ